MNRKLADRVFTRAPEVPVEIGHPEISNRLLEGENSPPTATSDGNESKYIRCRFCGFICNMDRDNECPLCGSDNYK